MMIKTILLGSLLALTTLAGSSSASDWSDAEIERFLLKGEIVKTELPPGGSSSSLRATLRLDDVEHDAMVHTLDEWKASFKLVDRTEIDFRDSYKNNIAAYRLDRLLGLGLVPVTVLRSYEGKPASFMWWVDDLKMYEDERLKKNIRPPDPGAWTRQMFTSRIFDQLIHNYDRNTGNLAIDTQWRIWMIDHTRSFKVFKELRDPDQLGTRCARELLAALRGLDEPGLQAVMAEVLNPDQIQGLLGRRDLIVAHFDDLIAQRGEVLVLFDLPSRGDETATR